MTILSLIAPNKNIPPRKLISALAAWVINKYTFRYFTIESKGFEFFLEVSPKTSPEKLLKVGIDGFAYVQKYGDFRF